MADKNGSVALAVREADASALAMVMDPGEAVQRLRELQAFVASVMVDGEDYGVLPGTKGRRLDDGTVEPPKKILYQPGAQKLAEVYGLAVRFEDERAPIERWEGSDPFFGYFKRAIITRRRDGLFLGSGLGSCNSREKKYASRWVFERDVPVELDKARLPKKEGVGRNNRPFVQYRVPNPEIFDLVNTIEKMACKRALVHAVIAVTRSSGLFTQDIEDLGGAEREAPREEVHDAEFVEETPPIRPEPPDDAFIGEQLAKAITAAMGAPSKDARAAILKALLDWCKTSNVPSAKAAKVREDFIASLRAAKPAPTTPDVDVERAALIDQGAA